MPVYTTDLIRTLARKHRRPHAHYAQAIKDLFEGIAAQLAHGESVHLTNYGTFYTRKQPAAHIKSIRSGQPITVRAHRVTAFRAGTLLRHAARTKL